CRLCGKQWPRDVEICPHDGTWLHDDETVTARAAVSQPGTFDSNTAIDPPFAGSLTPLVEVSAHQVRASGSAMPTRPYAQPAIETLASSLPIGPPQRSGTPIPFPRGTRVGDYEIEGKIGEGAMGAVYRAVHPSLGKHVAVKVMNPRLCDDPAA